MQSQLIDLTGPTCQAVPLPSVVRRTGVLTGQTTSGVEKEKRAIAAKLTAF